MLTHVVTLKNMCFFECFLEPPKRPKNGCFWPLFGHPKKGPFLAVFHVFSIFFMRGVIGFHIGKNFFKFSSKMAKSRTLMGNRPRALRGHPPKNGVFRALPGCTSMCPCYVCNWFLNTIVMATLVSTLPCRACVIFNPSFKASKKTPFSRS